MKKWIYLSLTFCAVLFVVWSCNNDDDTSTPAVDENKAPTIEATTFEVPEDQTEVGEVSANDEDEDELSFSITENSNGLFVIDQNTGALTLAEGKVLDFEDEAFAEGDPVYTITVQVKDGNEGTASASMTINVTNVNEAPEFTNETFAFEVSESIDASSIIETFTASDPDAEDELTFSISENDNELFAIDAETGALGLAEGKSLNFDSSQKHILTVEVTDKEELSATKEVTITVTEVDEENQSPTIEEGQNFPVAEDKAAGEVFGTVNAEDPEADELTFEIIEDASELFAISKDTGELSLAEGKSLDFEDEAFNGEAPVYTLTIRVSDNNTFTDGEITITVTDVDDEGEGEDEEGEQNSAPQITNETIEFDVAENITDETVIVTVMADDPDEGDTLNFSITDNTGTFEINAETGEVSLAEGESLDFEGQVQQYEITVQVTDGAENNDQEEFTINVTNVNEAPVYTGEATFNTPENIDADQVIGTLGLEDITDPEDDAITFQILGDTPFEINEQGQITLKQNEELDFESLGQGENPIVITVQISDGENDVNEEVTIEVTDVDEAPEYDGIKDFNTSENIDTEEVIGTLSLDDITDPQNDPITFTILGDTSFEINEQGQITLKQNEELDFESLGQGENPIEITVRISDDGQNSSDVEVTIMVENVLEPGELAQDPNSFITTWSTSVIDEDVTIGINSFIEYEYDFIIDWGDGTLEELSFIGKSSFSHTYQNTGNHIVAIKGDGNFPHFRAFSLTQEERLKLQSIDQWGSVVWQSMERAFQGCENMEYNAMDTPILTEVTSIGRIFSGATNFDGNLGNWDVTNVEIMEFAFAYTAFAGNGMGNWNTESVTNMSSMFRDSPFNTDISGWNTKNVDSMNSMFNDSPFNWDIGGWNIQSLTEAPFMFSNSGMSVENYSATLIGWATLDDGEAQVPEMVDFKFQSDMMYCLDAEQERDDLITNHNWEISSDAPTGADCN